MPFFKLMKNRAVRCGCYKYLDIFDSFSKRRGKELGLSNLDANLFDMCAGTSDYITARSNNQEEDVVTNNAVVRFRLLDLLSNPLYFLYVSSFLSPMYEEYLTIALDCHLDATYPDTTPNYSVCPND